MFLKLRNKMRSEAIKKSRIGFLLDILLGKQTLKMISYIITSLLSGTYFFLQIWSTLCRSLKKMVANFLAEDGR